MRKTGLKRLLFAAAEAAAWVMLLPGLLLWKTSLFRYMTFATALSLVPGNPGMILRRVWYRGTLKSCGANLMVDFLGWIRTADTRVGDNVYIGVGSYVGRAVLGNNIMISSRVTVMSGRRQHRTDVPDTPMNQSGGGDTLVTVGDDVWIGTHAVVGADVADHCVVGAGAVVVHPTEPWDVVAGVPAHRIKKRQQEGA